MNGAEAGVARTAGDATRAIRRTLWVALALNAAVAVAKITYGRMTDFLAIEADGYHSLTDGLSTVAALVGLSFARRPPDEEHPYGHGKLEVLVAAGIGVSLLVLGGELAGDVVTHLREGSVHRPRIGPGAFVVLLATLAVNVGVSLYQERQGRRHGSPLLLSDARHTRSDCWVTGGVLVTAVLTHVGLPELDVLAATLVAALVGKAGIDVLRSNLRYLVDTALVDPEHVRSIAARTPTVIGVHRVRTRGTPDAIFMDLRIRIPGELSVADADRASRQLAEAIRRELASVVDVTIHPDPIPTTKEETHEPANARM